ncbi:serine/threonine protein kinase [Rivularia sp. PCC 7116]|uniref:serine/threonine-protein kinase n=1 Tax=Rivularia sp. PCC 7116 TaxID=373994 RepID=UPI00029EF5B9|nr:serine/threonine-protein kinase [Rivularia sp. PCC 7116]AFY53302.1 serine/threonine protein kinase [Rivularia sp. PCC 7116]
MLLNNRYRIIQTLGSGGFGETFLAEDTQIPSTRRCVIKQLRIIQDNPQTYEIVQQRFAREAAILEELGDGSSQIPRLYAYFSEGQRFYLAQEYIQGQTLSEIIANRGRLNESRVREILIGLLNVLEYVHSKGIVHRDIKPENIIVRSSDNQPVLIDFGAVRETMAAQVNASGNVTSSIVIGTPGFMAVEQAAGRAVFASDLYSLGLVAIYLLTAKMPQELETDSYSGEIIWQTNGISNNFALVLDKAIRSHIRERFSSAREMIEALQSQLIQPTVPIVPSPPAKMAKSSTSGNWFKSALIGGLMGGCALLAFAYFREQPRRQPEKTTETQQPTVTPSKTATIPPVKQVDSFYFLADSAFRQINNANNQIRELKNAGYNQTGKFWLPDYPNLSNNPYHQVYVAKFNSRANCIDSLKDYVRRNQNAYCALASENANASPNYFYGSQVKIPKTDSQPSPSQAVRDYYQTINNRNYTASWNQLTPKFKREKSNNRYSEYTNWWNKVQRVEVEQAKNLSTTSNTATVETQMKYYLKSGRVITDAQRFKLVWNSTQQNWNFDDSSKLN